MGIMSFFKEAGKDGVIVALAQAEAFRQFFCHHVEIVNVIIDEVEKVAHLFIGRGFGEGGGSAQTVIEARELFAVAPIGLMAGDQRVSEAGGVLHDQFQFLRGRGIGFEQRVRQGFGEGRE